MHKWIGTYNLYRIHLLRFFKWLYSPDLEPDKRPKPSVIDNIPELKRKEISIYKPSDMWTPTDDLLFLKYCPSKRDSCYHAISRDLSARPHEILKLKIKDVAFKTSGRYQYGEVVVNGKTGTRPIPLIKVFILPVVPISIVIKLLLETSRKQFGFYFSMGCFNIVRQVSDDVCKAKYFRMGIEWYNKFLKKNVSLQINNIELIHSTLLMDSAISNNRLSNSILDTFDESDKFRPLRHILSSFFPELKEKDVLVKEPAKIKLKESSDLIIPIVTIIITIITTFFIKPLQ